MTHKLEKNPDITCLYLCRCCNSCDDVREAYRRRGWAFKNADTIEQCKREGFTQKMQEQKNEGCEVYGVLEVNKVEAQLLCFIFWRRSVDCIRFNPEKYPPNHPLSCLCSLFPFV